MNHNKLREALVDDRHRAIKAHGNGSWDVADVMAVVVPEIERREHHYKVTLARLALKLRALSEDAEAQIL